MFTVTTGAASEQRSLALLLGAALVLRLAVLPFTADLGARIGDETHYEQLALSLADGHGFSNSNGPTSLRPPLYPALIAGTWTLTGTRSLQPVRVVQIGLAIATAALAYAIGRELFGARAGLAAAAVAAFYPSLLVSNYLLLTEVLFAFFVTAATWAIVRLLATGAWRWAAAAGALVALAALTRSVLYPFTVVLPLIVLAGARAGLRQRAIAASVCLVTSVLVLAPWAIRNTRLQGVPVLVDTMGGMNLRMGNYEYTPLDRMWDAVSVPGDRSWIVGIPYAPPEGGTWTEGKKERWARAAAIRFMTTHPGLTAARSLVKLGDFWGLERDFLAGVQQGLWSPPPAVTFALTALIMTSYPLVLVLAVFGIARLTPANRVEIWIPLAITLFVCALHAIVFGHPRYRLPLTPLLSVYAGAALAGQPVAGRSRIWSTWAPATLCGLFAVSWVVQFAWRDWAAVERLMVVAGVVQ